MNVPNFLTSVRIALSPILALLFLFDSVEVLVLIVAVVLLSELTDILDGYLARKWNQVTDLGKIIDPLADSLYRDTILLFLAVKHKVTFLLVLPIIYHDAIVSTLRSVSAFKGIQIPDRASGFFKDLLQAIFIIVILLLQILAATHPSYQSQVFLLSNLFMGLSCILAFYSAYDFIKFLSPKLKTRYL